MKQLTRATTYARSRGPPAAASTALLCKCGRTRTGSLGGPCRPTVAHLRETLRPFSSCTPTLPLASRLRIITPLWPFNAGSAVREDACDTCRRLQVRHGFLLRVCTFTSGCNQPGLEPLNDSRTHLHSCALLHCVRLAEDRFSYWTQKNICSRAQAILQEQRDGLPGSARGGLPQPAPQPGASKFAPSLIVAPSAALPRAPSQ